MTVVAYIVGTEYTKSYSEALEKSSKLNQPIKRCYIPIPEYPSELSEDEEALRQKRVARWLASKKKTGDDIA